jgi:hypothetical protein
MYVAVRPKHNSTMVSDASPGTADPKMNESFVHTAQMSYDRECAQDGCFKRPHPTIIDDDKWSDSGWFCVGFGVGGRLHYKRFTKHAKWRGEKFFFMTQQKVLVLVLHFLRQP